MEPDLMPQETMEEESWIRFVNFDGLPFAVTVVVLGAILAHFVSLGLDRIGERAAGRRLWFKKSAAVARYAIYVATLAVALPSALILEQTALIAIAGSLGIALGFGFKDVLTSITGGVVLLLDAPFQVGDRIAFGEYYGEVVKIGLRSVQLVTLDDNLVTIPNSSFLTDSVASANSGALDCMVVIPFYIGAGEDFDTARRLVVEATVTSRYVYLEKPVVTLVSDEFLGQRFVTVIRVKAYVFDVRYEKAFASDVTERVKRAFASKGIRTPDQLPDLAPRPEAPISNPR